MKRFRISILALIAIAAIGLTAATKAEVNSAKKFTSYPNCYTSLTSLSPTCTDVVLDAPSNVACLAIARPQVGEGVRLLNSGVSVPIECDDFDVIFCCAELTVDEAPCSTNQTPITFVDIVDGVTKFNYAKIATIRCKS